jgi:hypothetical protein
MVSSSMSCPRFQRTKSSGSKTWPRTRSRSTPRMRRK